MDLLLEVAFENDVGQAGPATPGSDAGSPSYQERLRAATEAVLEEHFGDFAAAAAAFRVEEDALKDAVMFEVVVGRLEPRGTAGYFSVADACRIAQVTDKTLKHAVDKYEATGHWQVKRGRRAAFSPGGLRAIQATGITNIGRVTGVNAVTGEDIIAAFDVQRRAQMGINADAVIPPLDPRTVTKYRDQLLPESCAKPHAKNARRVQAANDPFNYVSQSVSNFIHFCPSLLGLGVDAQASDSHSIDEASLILNEGGPVQVFGPAGSKAALDEFNTGWGFQPKDKKSMCRSVRLFADTTETGEASFAWVIYDRDVKVMKFCVLDNNLVVLVVPKSAKQDAGAKALAKTERAAKKQKKQGSFVARMRKLVLGLGFGKKGSSSSSSGAPAAAAAEEEEEPDYSGSDDDAAGGAAGAESEEDEDGDSLRDEICAGANKEELMRWLISKWFLPLAAARQKALEIDALNDSLTEMQNRFSERGRTSPDGSASTASTRPSCQHRTVRVVGTVKF